MEIFALKKSYLIFILFPWVFEINHYIIGQLTLFYLLLQLTSTFIGDNMKLV